MIFRLLPFVLVPFCAFAQEAPRNVIYLIGDGMGYEQIRAANLFLGRSFSFQEFPFQADMTTNSADNRITDSAAAATSFATGRKVNRRVLSVAVPGDGSPLETILETFQANGKRTGLVSTRWMTDATPAAFAAHVDWRLNFARIASDIFQETRPNVLFGGAVHGVEDAATLATDSGYTLVSNQAELFALDSSTVEFVSGQFGEDHLPYEFDGLGDLPHLSEMAAVALDIVSRDEEGFFLMIEGGRIDEAAHDWDLERMIHEIAEFDNAVQLVTSFAVGRDDTLVLVIPDHETGGLRILEDNGVGNLPTVSWRSNDHTEVNVPAYAMGFGAEQVAGEIDNTDIYRIAMGRETPRFIRGDTNSDGQVNLSDAIFALNFLFTLGLEPTCLKAADVNDDGEIDVSDPVFLLLALFRDQEIPQPFPGRGEDPTADRLSCS